MAAFLIPHDLDELGDVDATSPSPGDALVWNGSDWVPLLISSDAGSLSGTTLAANVIHSSLTGAAGGAFGSAAYANTGAFDAAGAAASVASATATALAGKSNVGHTHTASQVTDFTAAVQALSPVPSQAGNAGKYLTTDGSAASWATVSGGGMAIGNTVISGTAGSVLFLGDAGVLAQDNSKLFWDAANHRLGVGTASPAVEVHVATSGMTESGDCQTRISIASGLGVGLTLDASAAGGKKISLVAGGHGNGFQLDDSFAVYNVTNGEYWLTVNASTFIITAANIPLDSGVWPKSVSFRQGPTNVASVKGVAPGDGTVALAITTSSGGVETEKVRVTGPGSLVVGTGAVSTAATDGFLYLPTCAGTPTGAPTAFAGTAAVVYDSVNDKICVYNGGWKKTAALT